MAIHTAYMRGTEMPLRIINHQTGRCCRSAQRCTRTPQYPATSKCATCSQSFSLHHGFSGYIPNGTWASRLHRIVTSSGAPSYCAWLKVCATCRNDLGQFICLRIRPKSRVPSSTATRRLCTPVVCLPFDVSHLILPICIAPYTAIILIGV